MAAEMNKELQPHVNRAQDVLNPHKVLQLFRRIPDSVRHYIENLDFFTSVVKYIIAMIYHLIIFHIQGFILLACCHCHFSFCTSDDALHIISFLSFFFFFFFFFFWARISQYL